MFTPVRLRLAMLGIAVGACSALLAGDPHSAGSAIATPASTTSTTSTTPAAPGAHHVMGRHRRHAGSKQQSLNWAGYVKAGTGFHGASGTWTVPALISTQGGFSSTWVGIDGATSGDRYLIQTGTEADVSGGRRTYRAWWEVITPTDVAPETVFRNLVITPGDSITASVARTASGRWTMRLRDNTTRRSASHTVSFAGPGASVEWIQEDTDVNGYISTAPNWGAVTFRSLRLDGASPGLTASQAVDIVDSQGTREATSSAPNAAGNGFTVTWLASGTRTAAS